MKCVSVGTRGRVFSARSESYATRKMVADYLNLLRIRRLHFLRMWPSGKRGDRNSLKHFGQRSEVRGGGFFFFCRIITWRQPSARMLIVMLTKPAVVVMDCRVRGKRRHLACHNGRLDPVLLIPFPDSVGYFYGEIHGVSGLSLTR